MADRAPSDVEAAVMTTAARLAARGYREGFEEGRKEGRLEVLVRLVTLEFGEPDGAIRARLAAADIETLDRWAERILTASTLDELFG